MVAVTSREQGYERRKKRTRESLIDAALAAFAERGFVATTAEQIAARAQVSRAGFYLHFESKSAIMIAALEERWWGKEDFISRFRSTLDSGNDVADLRGALEANLGEATFPVAALHSATSSDPAVAEWYFHQQEGAFAQLIAGSEFTGVEIERMRSRFHLLGRMTLDAMTPAISTRATVAADQAAAYVADLWLDLLREFAARPAGGDNTPRWGTQ